MIGWAKQAYNLYNGKYGKNMAQSIPASLFYRDEGFGIHYPSAVKNVDDFLASGRNEEFRSEGTYVGKSQVLRHLPFNLFISEKHAMNFKVSEHPLQDGCVISDHVTRELREVTIEGMFTNHPLKKLEDVSEVSFKKLERQAANEDIEPTVSNTALANFEKLKKIANRKMPVRVVCALEIYPKMIITSIDYERGPKSGSSIKFTMKLRELVTVSLRQTTLTYNFTPQQIKDASDALIAAEVNIGKKNATEREAHVLAEAQQAIDLEDISY
ncbi:MAG: hypothetical protein IKS96_07285 [Fibrobacter sp.]|nr:hypothetical protein [Fibrobacter sp.]MBR6449731.1 hypothetical protein [Fibrobacter sp.]